MKQLNLGSLINTVYDKTLGYNTATSKESAIQSVDTARGIRKRVYTFLQDCDQAVCNDDIARALFPDMDLQKAIDKVYRRVVDLRQEGLVISVGTTKNRNNRTVFLWNAASPEDAIKLPAKHERLQARIDELEKEVRELKKG